jgi:hypothetical protein
MSEDERHCCEVCGNETAGAEVCGGCANEAAGLCRWCGRGRELESDLCASCAESGDIAASAGSFEAAQPTINWWREHAQLP